MIDFLIGFLAGSVTWYLLYVPVKPVIYIELTDLRKFLVFTDKNEHAPQTNGEAASSSEAKPQESTGQMETDVSSCSGKGDAASSSETEAVLSWSAQLFEPVHVAIFCRA